MAIEESSVVAAAGNSAKFWSTRGGFKTEIIETVKVGQVHFLFYGDSKKLYDFCDSVSTRVPVFIDEAYLEISKGGLKNSMVGLVSKGRDVIITRTFSKIYGLAGLRVGWGYGSKEIISALNKVKPPFNVSRPALFAASAAVKDSAWLNKEIKHVNKWSKKMFSEFKKMRIETNKSFTNFLLVKFDKVKINSAKVFGLLAKSGILVLSLIHI